MEKTEKRRKILVTGSSGMLGVDLCQMLASNYDVFGADMCFRNEGGLSEMNFFACDITDENAIKNTFDSVQPWAVIHAAAWTDVDACELDTKKSDLVNYRGSVNISRICSDGDIPLIFISTDFVFDGTKQTLYREDDTPNPINYYGVTKFKAEKEVAKLNKFIIVRTSWLFGKFGRNFPDTIIDNARKTKVLKVVDDQTGSPTYTKDLSEAILRLLDLFGAPGSAHINGICNFSNSGTVSWYEFAKKIIELCGIKDVTVKPIHSRELARAAKRPAFSGLDTARFERLTGVKPRDWTAAIKEYIDEKIDFRGS